ncbi:MAG: barstar family protein [Firmicutes bacterium]|nr:barstar family protein [Bacillota bacterium]
MKKVTIDTHKLTTMAEIHDHLAKELNFPDYYGKNLDALYDCLTEINEETEIELLAEEGTFLPLRKVFTAATKSNKNLIIIK